MTDDLIGKTIGGCEILDVVGRGGMATVYRAQQVSMNRTVAVKVLPQQYVNDDTYLQRFNQEVRIVAKLEHRNIVPVHDYGEYNGRPYIVMRYMPAGSADDLLKNGPLDIEAIVNIIEQIAPALDYAHGKSVLHRDLKPSNVLLDNDNGAYLTDFGIARVLGEQGSSGITTQGVVGTPSYMSPEQAQGLTLDNRSDIYSLGVMLFEIATGRRPFESDTPYSIAVMQVTTPPPSPRSINSQLSFAVEEVILKAMRKKREERYPHAIALAEALKRAVNKPVVNVHDTQPGMQRPPLRVAQPAPAQPQPIPPPIAQSPVYAVPAANQPAAPASSGYVPRRRRRQRGSNVWVSAALGGLLGCGLLAIIVIVVVIALTALANNNPTAAEPSSSTGATEANQSLKETPYPTLEPTSQTARLTKVPGNTVRKTDTSTSPGIAPVGVRETPTP
jgi:serine/threonine-protein kinase